MDSNPTPQGDSVSTPKGKSSKKPVIIISIIGVIVVAALVCVIIFLLNQKPTVVTEQVPTGNSANGVLANEDNIDELQSKQHDLNSYTTEMNSDWYFENGSSASSNSYVRNNEHNTNPVWFDIHLESNSVGEEGELVYTSPKMPVKTAIRDIKLAKVLPAGNYNAILTYHVVDDNDTELRDVSVAIRLHVQN